MSSYILGGFKNRTLTRLTTRLSIGYLAGLTLSQLAQEKWASIPRVAILIAHDIVFAEIAAGLHLDHLDRDFPWIFQTMRRA